MKYQEITILPDEGISINYLWSKIYLILHIALADYKNKTGKQDIGISMPGLSKDHMGNKIRIFGEEEELKTLHLKERLERYEDYTHVTKIRDLPGVIKGYAIYSRYQPENSIESKARRYAKRHETAYEEALTFIKRKPNKKYPYIMMTSMSTGQKFHLCINKKAATQTECSDFSTYGLSAAASVPEF